MKDFPKPGRHNEQPIDALDAWCVANYNRIPEMLRGDCERALLAMAPDEMMARWRDQHARGVRIGSDDPFFHMDVGMQVRNCLRGQLRDDELPEVTTDSDGNPYGPSRNWDDYYIGALVAIMGPAGQSKENLT